MNGDDVQCIGLARATGAAPDLTWTDSGEPVTCSIDPESNGDINQPNAIDPAVFHDEDGSMHLIFGGGRIWMTELDPVTGGQQSSDEWPVFMYFMVRTADRGELVERG